MVVGARLAFAAALALLLSGSPTPASPSEERVAELRAAIERDRERLKVLISAPESPGDEALRMSAELREIALRLPRLQRELREASSAPDARPVPASE